VNSDRCHRSAARAHRGAGACTRYSPASRRSAYRFTPSTVLCPSMFRSLALSWYSAILYWLLKSGTTGRIRDDPYDPNVHRIREQVQYALRTAVYQHRHQPNFATECGCDCLLSRRLCTCGMYMHSGHAARAGTRDKCTWASTSRGFAWIVTSGSGVATRAREAGALGTQCERLSATSSSEADGQAVTLTALRLCNST
jgi:hypothetical protein